MLNINQGYKEEKATCHQHLAYEKSNEQIKQKQNWTQC